MFTFLSCALAASINTVSVFLSVCLQHCQISVVLICCYVFENVLVLPTDNQTAKSYAKEIPLAIQVR